MLGVAVAVLAGCPNPITVDTFRQMSDRSTPIVEIASPAENSPYTQTVSVTGPPWTRTAVCVP